MYYAVHNFFCNLQPCSFMQFLSSVQTWWLWILLSFIRTCVLCIDCVLFCGCLLNNNISNNKEMNEESDHHGILLSMRQHGSSVKLAHVRQAVVDATVWKTEQKMPRFLQRFRVKLNMCGDLKARLKQIWDYLTQSINTQFIKQSHRGNYA